MTKHDPGELVITEVDGTRTAGDDEEKVFAGSTVPARYRGTQADQHEMVVLGKK